MTGISGTSKTERKYHYYQCVTNRRDKSCDKKTVGKEYIEDLVVNRLRDFLTPDNISTIAREAVSYTHLDVYKRQHVLGDGVRCFGCDVDHPVDVPP